MENNGISEKKESKSPLGQSMPSRRAIRHIERTQILKEEKKEDVPDVVQKEETGSMAGYDGQPDKTPETGKPTGKKPVLKIILGIIALLIVAAVIAGIVIYAGKDKKSSHSRNYMDQLRMQEIRLCEDDPFNTFFRSYYYALSVGDTTILEGMFDDPSKADVSAGVSTIVESYENLSVYITEGINENEYAAFVYNDVKFNNIGTLAPSVDCYYLEMEEDGGVKICWDMYQNEEKIRFLRLASYMMPIRQLLADSDAALQNALNQDKDLKNLYIVMQSMTDAVLEQDASTTGK